MNTPIPSESYHVGASPFALVPIAPAGSLLPAPGHRPSVCAPAQNTEGHLIAAEAA